MIGCTLISGGCLNDTHREKLFYSIQYKNGWLAACDLFEMFSQSVKFYYTFYYHVLRGRIFEKCDPFSLLNKIDSKNERLLLPASFRAKFGLVCVLTLENIFSLRFHFKANRKSICFSKKRY